MQFDYTAAGRLAPDKSNAEALANAAPKMAPHLIKGAQAEYIVEPWDGNDTSGLRVFSGHVLVRMDVSSEFSKGGVIIDVNDRIERMNEASVTGRIIKMGPDAFQTGRYGGEWIGERPEIGQRVYTEKYPGVKAVGVDGRYYRVMEDTCIACVIDEQASGVEG